MTQQSQHCLEPLPARVQEPQRPASGRAGAKVLGHPVPSAGSDIVLTAVSSPCSDGLGALPAPSVLRSDLGGCSWLGDLQARSSGLEIPQISQHHLIHLHFTQMSQS